MELNKENSINPTWLFQRAKANQSFNPETLTSDYLKLDYMGSAEFEFGAFQKFIKDTATQLSKFSVFSVTHNNTTLFFSCTPKQVSRYTEILKNILDERQYLKAGSRINSREITYKKVGKKEKPIFDDPNASYLFDTWLDYTNNLFVSRNEETVKNLMVTIKNSANYIQELEAKEQK